MNGIAIEGKEDLLQNLKRFHGETTKKTLVHRAQRLAFRKSGMISIAKRNTPRSDAPHKDKQGFTYQPGNLRASIGLITGKSKKFPNIQLGFRAGRKRKNDGWYGFIVHEGKGRGQSPKPALKRAREFRGDALVDLFGRELGKVMKRRKKKYGF